MERQAGLARWLNAGSGKIPGSLYKKYRERRRSEMSTPMII